jgi:tRNA dimethylallyltransferase
VDLIQRNSRKFARKQLTWFRKENRYLWYSPLQCGEIIEKIEKETGYL